MSMLTRDQVFDQLNDREIATARIAFHGGGDEGDIESVAYYGPDGRDLDIEIDKDSSLFEGLCQPIYDVYGGFAGDPQVDAELVWTVATQTLTLEGSEKEWTSFAQTL